MSKFFYNDLFGVPANKRLIRAVNDKLKDHNSNLVVSNEATLLVNPESGKSYIEWYDGETGTASRTCWRLDLALMNVMHTGCTTGCFWSEPVHVYNFP